MAKSVKFPTYNEKLDNFMLNVVWKYDAHVRLYDKQSSVLMWVIYVVGFMWIWLPNFFKDYHTTIGNRVYIKRESILLEDWGSVYKVMRHEFIHIIQRKKYWLFYDFAYLFPQVLAIFSIPAIMAIWFEPQWLYALVFLFFLLPLPSYWRMKFEMEGYTQTLLVHYETHGNISPAVVSAIAKKFTNSSYYFMWPFKEDVRRRLDDIAYYIRRDKINTPYRHYSH